MNGPSFGPLGVSPLIFLTAQALAGLAFQLAETAWKMHFILQVVPGDLGLDLTKGRGEPALGTFEGSRANYKTPRANSAPAAVLRLLPQGRLWPELPVAAKGTVSRNCISLVACP